MMKKKIIGTGLSGLVGSRIRELTNDKFHWVDFSLETGIDILDFSLLKEAFETHKDAEGVVHLAAFTDTNAAWQQRGDKKGLCYRLNVEGTRNIVDLCRRYKKYLVYISTDFVFDGKKKGAYSEEDKPDPIEWYGYTKFLGEQVVEKSGLKAAIARIAFPYRAAFPKKQDLIRKILTGIKENSLYPMFTDQTITPTFIDDISLGIAVFLEKKPQGIFHLTGSSSHSPYQIALTVAQIFGLPPERIKKGSLRQYLQSLPPGSKPYQQNLALSNQKIRKLGVVMKKLKDGLLMIKKQMEGK